jgi:hypothetical protein
MAVEASPQDSRDVLVSIVGMVWDPAERLFGDRLSKDDDETLLTELT